MALDIRTSFASQLLQLEEKRVVMSMLALLLFDSVLNTYALLRALSNCDEIISDATTMKGRIVA